MPCFILGSNSAILCNTDPLHTYSQTHAHVGMPMPAAHAQSTEYRKEAQETIRHELDELSSVQHRTCIELISCLVSDVKDAAAKQTLLGGKRVVLSEEIEILRHIQSKLDAFVKALKRE